MIGIFVAVIVVLTVELPMTRDVELITALTVELPILRDDELAVVLTVELPIKRVLDTKVLEDSAVELTVEDPIVRVPRVGNVILEEFAVNTTLFPAYILNVLEPEYSILLLPVDSKTRLLT